MAAWLSPRNRQVPMASPTDSTPPSRFTPDAQPLAARVRHRVASTAIALDGTVRPRGETLAPHERQRVRTVRRRALRQVFREMGVAQRQFRRERGQAPVPAVRDAAAAFREAPSLTALVAVAASLETAGMLGW